MILLLNLFQPIIHPEELGEPMMNLVRFISIRRLMTFFGLSGSFMLLVGIGVWLRALGIFMSSGSMPLTMALVGGFVVIVGLLLMVSGLILYSISQMMNMVVGR